MSETDATKRPAILGDAPSSELNPASVQVLVLGVIIALGAMQFFFTQRAADFVGDDVFFADAARSLLHRGIYGINGSVEGNLPPGLSATLTLVCAAGGCTRAAFLHAMVLFQTLAFVATYLLLRRLVPHLTAIIICLLLVSSEPYFSAATQLLYPNHPYFFTATSALLVALNLEKASSVPARVAWSALLALLCAAALLFATTGVALLVALSVRIAVLLYRKRRAALSSVSALAVPLLVGVVVQAVWAHHPRAPLEWPIAGYPRPYLEQLLVKSGNHPELGMATWHDIPLRIGENALVYTAFLAQLLAHHWVSSSWTSVAVLGPLLLILLGWFSSIKASGGEVHDWYLAGYALMYLLWPWAFVPRFLLPVAPLACLYLWRGLLGVGHLATHAARSVGLVWLPASLLLTIATGRDVRAAAVHRPGALASLQSDVSLAAWILSVIVAAWLIWTGSPKTLAQSPRPDGDERSFARLLSSLPTRLVGGITVVGMILWGVSQQLATGRANLDLRSELNSAPPDARAASWIATHSDSSAVVMARHVPLASHYSGRKVVWFPPSTDSKLLMDGIRRLGVGYVIVVHRAFDIYQPADEDCFAPLVAMYPNAFHLVFQDSGFKVFAVQHTEGPELPLGGRAHPVGAPPLRITLR